MQCDRQRAFWRWAGLTHYRQGHRREPGLVSEPSLCCMTAKRARFGPGYHSGYPDGPVTNQPTPWSSVLPQKLPGPQLVNKFPAFYRTRRSITAFTTARHMSLSTATVQCQRELLFSVFKYTCSCPHWGLNVMASVDTPLSHTHTHTVKNLASSWLECPHRAVTPSSQNS